MFFSLYLITISVQENTLRVLRIDFAKKAKITISPSLYKQYGFINNAISSTLSETPQCNLIITKESLFCLLRSPKAKHISREFVTTNQHYDKLISEHPLLGNIFLSQTVTPNHLPKGKARYFKWA